MSTLATKGVSRSARWRQANPDANKRHELKAKYGITLEQYNQMLGDQNGVCAICKKPETKRLAGKTQTLAVDHCHKTGNIRGLLCSKCNLGIGNLMDNPEIILAAASYIVLKGNS